MEKKFPPRVWLDSIDIEEAEYGSYHWTKEAPDDTKFDVEYLSREEHQALIAPLIEALKRYETAAFDVNGQIFSVGSIAKQALENYKKQTGK